MASGKEKNKSKLLIVCVVLSIILICGGIVELVLPCDGLACLGKSIAIVYVPICLFCIWVFYSCIIILQYLYKKKKIFVILLVIILAILALGLIYTPSIIKILKPEKKDLSYVFSDIDYDKQDFLIHNDIIYYANYNSNDSMLFDITTITLNSMNLDGSNNKVLCTGLDEYFTENKFYFVEGNELYYGDIEGDNYQTINLSTCVVSEPRYYFIKKLDNDRIVYIYKTGNGFTNGEGSNIIQYDIKNDKKLGERYVSFDVRESNIIIDYQNFNIYGVEYDYKQNETKVYVNADLILNKKGLSLDLLLLKDNYLLLSDNNKIYVMDLNSNLIIKEIEHNFKKVYAINSDTNDNYFLADNRIYSYNLIENNIENVFDKTVDGYYKNVYHFGNKLVFDSESCKIMIYDTVSQEVTKYENVLYRYDSGKLYIISKDENLNKVNIEVIK